MESLPTPKFKRELPFLMNLGMIGGGMFAVVSAILLPATIFGFGTYMIAGREVTPEEFWRAGAGFVFIVVATWLGAASWGIRHERLWARPLAAVFWPAMLLASPLIMDISSPRATDQLDNLTFCAIASVVALWYFYGKRTVRSYYAALSTDKAARTPSPSAGG